MNDIELLDVLSALLPAQFDTLLIYARVPAQFLPPPNAPVVHERQRLRDLGIEPIAYGPAGNHSRLPDVLRYLAQPCPPAAPSVAVVGTPSPAV